MSKLKPVKRRSSSAAKVVAMLVSPDATDIDRKRARNAGRGLRAMRKGATLGGLKIKDLISEGRL